MQHYITQNTVPVSLGSKAYKWAASNLRLQLTSAAASMATEKVVRTFWWLLKAVGNAWTALLTALSISQPI